MLWRFWNDPDGEGQYFLVTKRREDRASVGIAFTFVIIAYATCFQVCSVGSCGWRTQLATYPLPGEVDVAGPTYTPFS